MGDPRMEGNRPSRLRRDRLRQRADAGAARKERRARQRDRLFDVPSQREPSPGPETDR
jgi:hypothetical protein